MSTLTWQEGVALDVLGVMLGRGSLPSFQGYTPPASPRAAFVQAVGERIVRRCLEELVRRGGWRPRTVLRDGRRVAGSVFEPELGSGFDLRFTESTARFAEQAARQLPLLSAVEGPARKAGTGKRQLRDMLIVTGNAPGDWLFFALVEENLPRLALSQEALTAIVPRIRQCSPLAFLLGLGGSGQLTDTHDRLRRLLAPSAVRLVECLDELFAQRWRAALALERGLAEAAVVSHDAFVRRWTNVSQVLHAWLAVLDEHRRLDLARAQMGALADWAVALAHRPDLRLSVRSWSLSRSVRDLEQAAEALASAVSLVDALDGRADEMRAQRYGDERYEEAQLFLQDHALIVEPCREELRGMARQLRGLIG
jgi:hypothetical protein